MSQNDYYKNFTSTYPLMKNDIEDQNEAIEQTNRLMTLESDLANTFGYSVEQASTAINWALKGSFNYIDNLNLGIKGTQEGFLEAAHNAGYMVDSVEELTSSDILDILEKAADQYGVLGKTAKEAMKTIQGSTKATKAAWTNLVTGIADDNADFDKLVNDFVDSVSAMLDNLIPRILIAIEGIGELIPKLGQMFLDHLAELITTGQNILNALLQGIVENIPQMAATITQVILSLVDFITQNLPMILQAGITILLELIKGITQALPDLIPTMIDALLLMVETLIDNIDLIIDAGIQLIIGLAEGLIEALPQLIDKIPEIIDKLINAIIENLPKIIEMGITLIIKLAEGLIKAIPQLISKVPQIITSLLNAITGGGFSKMLQAGKDLLNKVKDGIASGISKIADVGKNLVQGLWNGINNAKDWVLGKIKGFGKSILNGIKSFFGIHSPSTVFKDEIGSNLALGIGEGFEDEMKNVSDMMDEAIPKDFDVGVNTNYDGVNIDNNTYSKDMLVEAFKEALDGMTFKAFDETFGELVVDKVEKVVYS